MCIRDRANTPGKRDGRIAFWIDGKLMGDFPNLRFREIENLKPNRVGFGLYTDNQNTVSYTHLRAHETVLDLVCRLLLEKKKKPPHQNRSRIQSSEFKKNNS